MVSLRPGQSFAPIELEFEKLSIITTYAMINSDCGQKFVRRAAGSAFYYGEP